MSLLCDIIELTATKLDLNDAFGSLELLHVCRNECYASARCCMHMNATSVHVDVTESGVSKHVISCRDDDGTTR